MSESRNEELLRGLLGDPVEFDEPQSRNEAVLQNMLGAHHELGEPQSRTEELLQQILEQGGGGYPEPTGSITITANGTHDVKDVAEAVVNVPEPTGMQLITSNGLHDIKDYAEAMVSVPQPSGSITITENGTHDVSMYADAVVDVPAGGVGQIEIHENGTHDVSQYAEALVDIQDTGAEIIDRSVTAIGIPDGVKDIGKYAFAECYSLQRVICPNSVELVDENAFRMCSVLEAVDLGAGIQWIYSDAFYYAGTCLKALIIRNTNQVVVANNPWGGVYRNLYIYVPRDLISQYQTATGWSGFSSDIFRAVEDYTDDGTVNGMFNFGLI